MLEKMDAFFEARLDGYDAHMLKNIEGAEQFYPYTASCLPQGKPHILDLGCGTGLELEFYFTKNPNAEVTGIDLSAAMLRALERKFPDQKLTLICGSYFSKDLGESIYDAAVSVESLHHFTKEEKISLYRKLHHALKEDGFFILTDYFAPTQALEEQYRNELVRLKKCQGINDDAFYHYDTPLTVEHEKEALLDAGFHTVEVLNNWEATVTIKASKK